MRRLIQRPASALEAFTRGFSIMFIAALIPLLAMMLKSFRLSHALTDLGVVFLITFIVSLLSGTFFGLFALIKAWAYAYLRSL